jgi:hypothetical protein
MSGSPGDVPPSFLRVIHDGVLSVTGNMNQSDIRVDIAKDQAKQRTWEIRRSSHITTMFGGHSIRS